MDSQQQRSGGSVIFTLAVLALLFLLIVTTVALLVIWSLSNEVADDCARAVGKFRGRHRLPASRNRKKEN